LLQRLAGRAIEVIAHRLEQGEEPATVIAEVLETVFGDVPASYGSDRAPGSPDTGPDQVIALIEDPDRRAEIVAAALRILTVEGGG
jgi:hypothetical protein